MRRKRAYHHGNLRQALIDAALELIEQRGVPALTLREVARRVGVTHAAPHRHFADRAALVAAVAEQGFRGLVDGARLRHPAHRRAGFEKIARGLDRCRDGPAPPRPRASRAGEEETAAAGPVASRSLDELKDERGGAEARRIGFRPLRASASPRLRVRSPSRFQSDPWSPGMQVFAGKVAVITGAGSGFGLEFARLGAREGMKLVLADVQEDALEAAVAEVRSRGAEAVGVRADMSNAEEVGRAAARAKSAFGAVHLLFNNAGVAGGGGYLWESSLKDWKWILGVNLMGVVHGIRSFVPLMLEHGGEGHVVNTASAAGLVSSPLMGGYNASKDAVVTLSANLHHQLRVVPFPLA